jgi:hypothetical protein
MERDTETSQNRIPMVGAFEDLDMALQACYDRVVDMSDEEVAKEWWHTYRLDLETTPFAAFNSDPQRVMTLIFSLRSL